MPEERADGSGLGRSQLAAGEVAVGDALDRVGERIHRACAHLPDEDLHCGNGTLWTDRFGLTRK